ncbi:unnamed protein product [Heterobilharzia americana]|nr:unnamed protein product [Heterobilharzia americana]
MDVNYLESLVILLQLSTIISSKPKHDLACREDHSEYLYYPGDVLLGGLFPIHQRPVISKGILQEPKLTAIGYKLLEAMLYAIDEINSRKNYLNYTLGALAFDTCENPDNALLQSLHFIVFNNLLDDASKVINYRRYATGGKPMETYILAVIGGSQSDVTISVANVLKFLYIPQISYMSSSSQLDDAEKYNYFLRTVPSITKTIDVIIELLRKYNWFYINVVLDSSEQGESNYGVFMEKLSQYSETICVAKDVRLIAYPLDAKDIARRLKTIQDSPASVNILLVTPKTANLAINELLKWNQIDRNRFLWIGTNGLIPSYRELYVTEDLNSKYVKEFNGFQKFILVLPYVIEEEKMKNYSINLRRTFNLTSWSNSYLLQFCGCLPNEVDLYNSSGEICTKNEEEECLSYLYKDSIYYVPQVVNSVYAVANALRQLFIQYPMVKWHNTSGEQMRKLLLAQLHQCQFEGFGNEIFTFFDKRDGQPKFTILTFLPYALKWKVLAQYGASTNHSFYYINENISTYIHETVPESVCSKPCNVGQIKRIEWGRSCCWTCVNCSSQQIVTSVVDSNNNYERSFYHAMSAMCQFCNPGYRPNKNQTKCQMLPIKYMSIQEIVAQASVGISSIGLILCLIVSVVCIKNWQTPIVKASGKETSIILFLGIILSYISGELILALPPSTFICNFAIFSVGFCITLTYSAIFARSSRINSIFQMYIILFRPYKNTRASIMQRLRGLSQVECMEWINEVASRSPPGVFSISRGKVLSPWLKIRELSSKSLGAAIQIKPDHKGNKSLIKTSSNKVADSKCLITEFSCGNSLMMKQFSLNSSAEHVDGDKQVIVRMRPQVVSFVEKHNNDRHEKDSITIEQCKNDTITGTVKNNLRHGSGINHKDDNHTALH